MKKLLEPFSFNLGQLQDISTLLEHLKGNNIPIESFIGYVKQEKINKLKANERVGEERKKVEAQWSKIAIKCPDCETSMFLFQVNTNPRDQIGGDLKSQWYCRKCEYAQYSKKTVQEILKERRR